MSNIGAQWRKVRSQCRSLTWFQWHCHLSHGRQGRMLCAKKGLCSQAGFSASSAPAWDPRPEIFCRRESACHCDCEHVAAACACVNQARHRPVARPLQEYLQTAGVWLLVCVINQGFDFGADVAAAPVVPHYAYGLKSTVVQTIGLPGTARAHFTRYNQAIAQHGMVATSCQKPFRTQYTNKARSITTLVCCRSISPCLMRPSSIGRAVVVCRCILRAFEGLNE